MTTFKKAAYLTDYHWGRSANNPVSLQDNVEFLDWFLEEAKTRGCETFIFGGDMFDNRFSLNLQTLDMTMKALGKINESFEKSIFLIGNHDLFFKDKRDITSLVVADLFDRIQVIRKPTMIGETMFLPWLVGREHQNLRLKGSRYVFSHLEFPGFLMNAAVEMPDSPDAIKREAFVEQEYVFSGHFHMRQVQANICYTGNVMPFNFSDAGDTDRGAMFLEWGKDPEFLAWPDQPTFQHMKLSELLDTGSTRLRKKTTLRISLDVDVTFEEANLIKSTFMSDYGLRRVEMLSPQKSMDEQEFSSEPTIYQSVDQIVIDGLSSVQGQDIKPEILISLYRNLTV